MKTILIVLFLVVSLGVEAKDLRPSAPASYVDALQTADTFLWAWVHRDEEAGRRLISGGLSDKLQKEKKEDWFRDYMVGVSNPHHHSFEIGQGKTINSKRLSFSVTLYEHYTGEPNAFEYKGRIEVIQEGDEWRVDFLPNTANNQ